MNIRHLEFAKGAGKAEGIAVIIDVFRAFSTSCYLYGQGAGKILVTDSIQQALRYREENHNAVLIGERNEKMIDGFDYGNSPSAVIREDFTDDTIVLTTSAGTKGLVMASRATKILAAGFVNAQATVTAILALKPETVSLVAMGYNAAIPADEDRLCADYIHNLLLGRIPDMNPLKKHIRLGTGARFFDPVNLNSPAEDFELCLQPGKFSFALEAVQENNLLWLKKINCNPV